MAWRRRQAMAKWDLGRRKWRGLGGGKDGQEAFPTTQGRATSFVPSATWPWPGAAARPWERPVNGNAITLNGYAGMGWGGVVYRQMLKSLAQVQRHFFCPKRQAMGTPSNWERPVTGNAITLNGNAITLDFRKRRGGVG